MCGQSHEQCGRFHQGMTEIEKVNVQIKALYMGQMGETSKNVTGISIKLNLIYSKTHS